MYSETSNPDELRARFTVYIERVVLHAKLDYIRKYRRTSREISLEDLDFEPSVSFEQQCIPYQEKLASFTFEEEKLSHAFSSLPLMRQRVLELLFVEELTPIEISRIMNCSVKYVYDQRYLALRKLRCLLKEGDQNDK